MIILLAYQDIAIAGEHVLPGQGNSGSEIFPMHEITHLRLVVVSKANHAA